MNIQKKILSTIRKAIFQIYPNISFKLKEEINALFKKENIIVENSKVEFGDFSFPSFILKKILQEDPIDINNKIINNPFFIKKVKLYFQSIELKGAYINFFLDQTKWMAFYFSKFLKTMKKKGKNSHPKNILIEYSSPNIAKPLSISHLRSTCLGEVLSKLFEFIGHKVTRINYIGDWGTPFAGLIYYYQQWMNDPIKKQKLDPLTINTLFEIYLEYNAKAADDVALSATIQDYLQKLENQDPSILPIWGKIQEVSIQAFQKIYKMMDIKYDLFMQESSSIKEIPSLMEILHKKHLIEKLETASIINLEAFDLGKPVIEKNNQTSLYLTRDLASALYREKRWKSYEMIYVVGSEQSFYFKQVNKILELMQHTNKIIHVSFGLITLSDKKLSTRKGHVIFLEDVIKRVYKMALNRIILKMNQGDLKTSPIYKKLKKRALTLSLSALYIADLKNDREQSVQFNWKDILNPKGETGIYIQYTYARLSSLIRKLKIDQKLDIKEIIISFNKKFSDKNMFSILKKMANLDKVLVKSANEYKPSHLVKYLIEICQEFNFFYQKNPILKQHNITKKMENIIFIYYVRLLLKNGLGILGIKALNKI